MTVLNPVFAKTNKSICFYYNEVDSIRELLNFDRVVLDPSNVTDKQITELHNAGISVYSYISVGEYDKSLPEALENAKIAENEEWKSSIMDVSSPIWRDYILARASELKKRHFDGLFLDTLDSFNAYTDEKEDKEYYDRQVEGLTNLVNDIHSVLPRLIFNRGFEIFDRISFKPDAVAGESVFKSYNAKDQSYSEVSAVDRDWLSSKLDHVKSSGVEAIAIDYLPDTDLDERIFLAKEIINKGYTPYVSDGLLYGFGVSYTYSVPKRILGVYDGTLGEPNLSFIHSTVTTPLEYNGYVVDLVDIYNIDVNQLYKSKYAALVFYPADSGGYTENTVLMSWLTSHVGYIPTLFLGVLPTNSDFLNAYGIDFLGEIEPPYSFDRKPDISKGIIDPPFSPNDRLFRFRVDENKGFKVLASVKNPAGVKSALMFKAPWGGAAVSPYPVFSLDNNQDIWLIDPFKFLDEMLALPKIPAADASSESGLRILTSHVDGDGFPSRSWFKGSPLVSEVLYNEVFSKIEIPHTVSVIEGETSPEGLYKEASPKLEELARKIFELPNVEVASHTYSHPFSWNIKSNMRKLVYGEFLPIPGYKEVDYDREVSGSINYINSRLCPPDKKVKVFLWSGNACPSPEAIEKVEKQGIVNVNGGNTIVLKGMDSLTNVSPVVYWTKKGVQVYAPMLNENVYTHEWTEHFDGFGRATESFDLTGHPRRLKSIAIYYHMYSGTYPSSLKALKSLYDYALSQDVTPMYLSEYAQRARTLYETGLGRNLDGSWRITSTGIRSLRVPAQFGLPVSSDIPGYNTCEDGNYLILNKKHNTVRFAKERDDRVMLKSANGIINKWIQNGNRIEFNIQSYIPLKLELWTKNKCQIVSSSEFESKEEDQVSIYQTKEKGSISGVLICN
ncbi:hypothetical protein SAMN02910357_02594 [Succinivibrio dextrinosolvens]|uniref:endo alpha-1,4 polygalactosaminidase n=1 Tax=Succinivibrio dextrinosolvens TaxID=83771 RepID=UPI0008F1A413|nr:endo alpha-1,4 polygalactosaminidase [Succinivibrio dextrinosolvens]SFS91920.1 hypothetical protein SAMN02910357_02594 [Succinivibrio dextrinosolvens]